MDSVWPSAKILQAAQRGICAMAKLDGIPYPLKALRSTASWIFYVPPGRDGGLQGYVACTGCLQASPPPENPPGTVLLLEEFLLAWHKAHSQCILPLEQLEVSPLEALLVPETPISSC